MSPIAAPEDEMLQDDAGDVDGGKPLNSWKRIQSIIRRGQNLYLRTELTQISGNQRGATMKEKTGLAEEVKLKKSER